MERSTVGSLLRTTQSFCQQICEKQTLDFGIAFYSRRFPDLPEANQLREVIVEDPAKIPQAIEQTHAWYGRQGLRCLRWAPAAGQAPDTLDGVLAAHGFRSRRLFAMCLSQWKPAPDAPGVRMAPARALREVFRQTYLAAEQPADRKARGDLADASCERMDDPQLDMFVATVDKQAAGRCGLYQVGDIARVVDLTVLPAYAGRNVEWALLGHVLLLAKRLTMPMVVAQMAEGDARRRRWFESSGFVEDGRLVEFELPSPYEALPPL